MPPRSRIFGIAAWLLVFGGCEARDADVAAARRQTRPANDPSAGVNFALLQPGDSLQGLRVEAIEVQPDRVDSFGWMGSVDYAGEVQLVGEAGPHPADPEVSELCFFVDDSVSSRLPRFSNDVRRPWFCFSNQGEAERLMGAGGAASRAQIVIDRYHYLYRHTDVFNTARLKSAVPLP